MIQQSTCGYISNGTESRVSKRELYAHMFIAALFIMTKSNSNVHQQMNK